MGRMERNIGQNLETREIDRERKVREMLEDKPQICRRSIICPDLYGNVCPCHPFSVSVGTCMSTTMFSHWNPICIKLILQGEADNKKACHSPL